MRFHWLAYERPNTVGEAIALLQEYQGQAKIIAGGTDLLIELERKNTILPAVIDVTSIPALGKIQDLDWCWEIGAAIRLSQILKHKSLSQLAPNLMEAIELIGSNQIRNVATLVGNVTNGSPAADSVLPLLTLDAKVVIANSKGNRIVPLEDFFISPRSTVCAPNELVVGVRIPKPDGRWVGAFEKLGLRHAMAIAVVNVAANVIWKDGKIIEARLAIGAVAPIPLLVREASQYLIGTSLEDEIIEHASLLAKETACPIDDLRSGASYRGKMVKALTIKCLHRIRLQKRDEFPALIE